MSLQAEDTVTYPSGTPINVTTKNTNARVNSGRIVVKAFKR